MSEKFICADCKGINYAKAGNDGGSFLKKLLLNLVLPGITIFLGRRKKIPKTCSFCGSDFLLPADTAETNSLLKSMEKIDTRL